MLMLKRRDFIGGAGAAVATQFLYRAALAQNPPAGAKAGPAQSSPTGSAPTPHDGLGANNNYWLYAGGEPLKDLVVEIELTEDFVAENGISFQLNGWSPKDARCTWQQYCYGFYTEDKAKPQLSWSIENWASNDYRDHLHQTIGLPEGGDMYNLHGERVAVPGPGVKIPAGYKFRIALLQDPKDATIIGAAYTVVDNKGRTIINDRPLIKSYKFSKTNVPIEPAAMAPIITAQVNVCQRAGGSYGFMESGAGKITYAASNILTFLSGHPQGMAAPGIVTAESANTVYGELPAVPGRQFVQTLNTIKAPGYRINGPFAAARRSDAPRADLFAIAATGQLDILSPNGPERWKKATAHGPINMAKPRTFIATTPRPGADAETGVFLADQHGQLQGFWVNAKGVSGPFAIGPKDICPPGAPVAASPQFGGHDQTDVFVFDKEGQLNVFWARGNGAFSEPVKVGPQGFVPGDGQLAASQRFGTSETSVFAVDKMGALSRFFVDTTGGWKGPEPISAPDFAKPGAHVAVVQAAGRGDQTDVIVLSKRGQLNVFSIQKSGGWSGSVAISAPGLADSGAAIAAAQRSGGMQADVFVVDHKETLMVISCDATGHWEQGKSIGQSGIAGSGANLAAAAPRGEGARADVFILIDDGSKIAAYPQVASVAGANAWSDLKKLPEV
jgi:hypothetical protein